MMKLYGTDSRELYRYDRYSMVECLTDGPSVHELHYLVKQGEDVLLQTVYHDTAMRFLQYLTDREN